MYDYDLFVIGAGSGGVRAARFAAGFGARVGIAENRYLGGTCVNVGCVPKKLLVFSAQVADDLDHATGYGWQTGERAFDWPTLIANKNREIARLNGIYQRLLENSGVAIHRARAQLVDEHTVEVEGRRYRAQHILVATGTWPQRPDIPGSEHVITSNEAFFLPQLPRRMLVVGGGYIAVEFASIFNGLGTDTTLVHRGERLLRGFDERLRTHVAEELAGRGIVLKLGTQPKRIARRDDGTLVTQLQDGTTVESDGVFYATGRRPLLDDLGPYAQTLARDERGFLKVDAEYRTSVPSILAVGDIIGTALGRLPLTPVAIAEGMAVSRRLFKPDAYRAVDYRAIPTAVFCLPNLGTVGLTEQQAREAGHDVQVFESSFRPMKLSLTEDTGRTLMKLVVDRGSDRVLGCHMAGPDAGEIIQGFAVALKAGATKQVFDDTIGIHPTAAEEFVTMRTPLAG
jgi:glutathione reductase (NADPH)